jgi:hypothetical protein
VKICRRLLLLCVLGDAFLSSSSSSCLE